MGFRLASADGKSIKVNVWNWGTLHRIVEVAEIFPDEVWLPMRGNGGARLDEAQVQMLVAFLEKKVLPALDEGERLDGTVTSVPDDGTFYRDEKDMWKNYSLDRHVLVAILAFLKDAVAPVAVH